GFIGTPPMNLLRLVDVAGGAVVRGTVGPVVRAGKGSGLLLGVRPEDVQLTAGGGVSFRVLSVEYLGAGSLVLGLGGAGPGAVGWSSLRVPAHRSRGRHAPCTCSTRRRDGASTRTLPPW